MEQEPKATLPSQTTDSSPHRDLPFWDGDLRRLHFRGECIKAFTGPAENQEAILAAFQKSGWVVIDNPLPPDPETNQHRQLEYAVRRLNGHQYPRQRLRFHVCGYGKKISWEAICGDQRARNRRSRKKKARTIK